MHLMYVDESGDPGLAEQSPTRYYVLSGLVVHELRWRGCLDMLVDFRRELRRKYGLRMKEEFHTAQMLTRPGALVRIKRHDRLAMIRAFADVLAAIPDLNILNVVVDKQGKPPDCDVFELAWKTLVQRFENTIGHHNFPGPANSDERGFVLADHTDDRKLMSVFRRMRHYNPIPNQESFGTGYRNLPLQYVIEDPSLRRSSHSYFIQAADLSAFLLYQHLTPSSYMRRNAGQNYFRRLKPVLCTVVLSNDAYGIVRL